MAVSFFFSSRVIQPLRLINQSWKDENSIPGANEVQQLAATFARLQASAIESERELAEQHRKIDTIFSLQFEADNPPSLEKFFRQALGIVQQVTGFDSITMRLYEPGTRTFRIMAQKGMTSEMLADLQTLPAESGFHAEIVQTHQPAFTSDMSGDPRMASSAPVREGYQSLVCIPLLAQDNLVGSIQLATREKILWSPDELRWLAVIGRRIGSLIQAIQLSERIRDMAVLEERSRIAQEIHDGFAQLVGSLRLWSEEAMLSLKKNELVDVQNTLQKIEANARDAYASLRIEILGLRESIFPGKELSSIIAEYLRRYQRQYGILTQLAKDESFIEPLPISPAAEIQLLRIIQEGLTNVRRHANAHNLSVEMSNLPGSLEIKIRDDGSGFNLENIPDDRLGLKIMRERASSIGGTISIDSRQGSGTRLEIRIPMNTISKKSVERS
jgi:two-component system nitrate/nitrite sensor histidine kinase NarX